ncbi:MAG: hypothetical protein GPJ54_01850 [Candidatus Heimdallarchaeota archaeon]|nr:hypothetical protein [Candidatus Heimdallarchaeota archaeon]
MNDRISQEIELLKERYPDLIHDENKTWVLIPNFKLPDKRFNKEFTNIHFTIPSGFPNSGPDNFFVHVDLRLANNQMPPAFNPNSKSNTGEAKAPGEWGWFSWHPNKWQPSAQFEKGDNLLSFVRSIGVRLRGG